MTSISRPFFLLAVCFGLLARVAAGEDRIPFPLLGTLVPRSAREIAASDWSIGCETLDRDFARYASYRSYLGPLGAKGARLQAGWAKTEKTAGTYDWQWLDEIVDDICQQAVQPWVQLSYGNPAYAGGGGRNIGEAGPTSPEAVAAWDRWARALVRRYRDRVHEWEIWNEPDISKRMTLAEYVELFVRTAEIIRAEQPEARIIALALASRAAYADEFLAAVAARQKLGLIDVITFHTYPENPDDLGTLSNLRKVVAKYPRAIELRQGETGAPSEKTTGALGKFAWDESRQAKWDLRRMLAHHGHGVPMNVFSLSDFYYPNGLNAKGLVRIRPDLSCPGPKPAYFAVQNVCGIFDHTIVLAPDIRVKTGESDNALAAYAYRAATSAAAMVTLWFKAEPPKTNDSYRPVNVTVEGAAWRDPVLVDLRFGKVYQVPGGHWRSAGPATEFTELPVGDSPLLLASRPDLRIKEESR